MKAFLYPSRSCLNARKWQGLKNTVSSVFLSWLELRAAKGPSPAAWVAADPGPSCCPGLPPPVLASSAGGTREFASGNIRFQLILPRANRCFQGTLSALQQPSVQTIPWSCLSPSVMLKPGFVTHVLHV